MLQTCSLQGLGMAGVTGFFQRPPTPYTRTAVTAAEPASTQLSPGDRWCGCSSAWGRWARPPSSAPGDFSRGLRSSRQLGGERVWLKKPRVERGTVRLPLHQMSRRLATCPVLPAASLGPPCGDPCRIVPPRWAMAVLFIACEGARAWESFSIASQRMTLAPAAVKDTWSETPSDAKHQTPPRGLLSRGQKSKVHPTDSLAEESSEPT